MNKAAGITGIGGVFIKSTDPEALRNWYRDELGVTTDDYGAYFPVADPGMPDKEAAAIWGVFKPDTKYFDPSARDFMVNFRVNDLDAFLKHLATKGIEQIGTPKEYEYGKFAWIQDPDGTKIELWEPAPKASIKDE